MPHVASDHFAQLDEIRQDLLAAADFADLVRVNLQLVTWLEGWSLSAHERDEKLLDLVKDAARLLYNQDALGWGSDVKDWLRAAAPFVRSDR